jgi:hypothetical protein
MRGNRWGTSAGLEFKEYEVGDMFYRKRNQMRTFTVQEIETYKISGKLAARYEGPYKIIEKVNAVVYDAEIYKCSEHETRSTPGSERAQKR